MLAHPLLPVCPICTWSSIPPWRPISTSFLVGVSSVWLTWLAVNDTVSLLYWRGLPPEKILAQHDGRHVVWDTSYIFQCSILERLVSCWISQVSVTQRRLGHFILQFCFSLQFQFCFLFTYTYNPRDLASHYDRPLYIVRGFCLPRWIISRWFL